jgi:hypothetical protein
LRQKRSVTLKIRRVAASAWHFIGRPHPYTSGRNKTNLNGYAGKESVEDEGCLSVARG